MNFPARLNTEVMILILPLPMLKCEIFISLGGGGGNKTTNHHKEKKSQHIKFHKFPTRSVGTIKQWDRLTCGVSYVGYIQNP